MFIHEYLTSKYRRLDQKPLFYGRKQSSELLTIPLLWLIIIKHVSING